MYVLNSDSSYVGAETVESVYHKINILSRINYITYPFTFLEKQFSFLPFFGQIFQ